MCIHEHVILISVQINKTVFKILWFFKMIKKKKSGICLDWSDSYLSGCFWWCGNGAFACN